jgi:predicted N-acyltransferase
MTTATEQLLGGLDVETWDRVVADSFYSTAAFLELCALHGGAEPGAAVLRGDGGGPVAVAPYAALTEPATALYRWNDVLAERGLPQIAADGLLVGPRQGYRTQLPVAGGHDRVAAVGALLEQLRERSLHHGGACVAMYVPTSDAQALVAAGATAQPVLLEADATFELPASGWDAWLATLPSKRRVSVRREVRRFEEAGYEIVRRPLSECVEQIPQLAGATQSRYGSSAPQDLWRKLLGMHIAAMGAAAQVALCMRPGDDEPVGFALYYVHGETLYLRWAGFDYSRLAGAAEYFNLMYYSHVVLAPQIGVRRLHAGIKTIEAKALRGARLRPLWLVDLAQDSPLAREREAVRAYNEAAAQRLRADARTRAALGDDLEWTAFT